MYKQIVHTNEAPAAIGPYNQGIITDAAKLFFSAGQIGMDPESNELISSQFTPQAEQALKNLRAILSEAGAALENVVKVTVYLRHMEDFTKFNEIYSRYFIRNTPARSVIGVADLPKNALVEIECIAFLTR